MNGMLFIDDEEGVRRSVMRALRKEPYPVYTAADGAAGIAFVKDHLNDLSTIISDYKMPGLDGLETLITIGRINPELTRVILTGYATLEAAIAATNEGIDGFLTKPFDNWALRSSLHDIVVRKHLRQFVPEPVYRKIEQRRGTLRPSYHEVTVLFTDIRGFTAMSQSVSPEKLVDFLNRHYFSPMGEIAYRHNGMVDKHLGDGIMVVFGVPDARPEDARNAVTAAVNMQREACDIDRRLRDADGLRLRTGIGIATGHVFSGVLGSMRKKEFTSIGTAVNVAARLQAYANAGEVMISEETARRVDGFFDSPLCRADRVPGIRIKGLDAPMDAYRIDAHRVPDPI